MPIFGEDPLLRDIDDPLDEATKVFIDDASLVFRKVWNKI